MLAPGRGHGVGLLGVAGGAQPAGRLGIAAGRLPGRLGTHAARGRGGLAGRRGRLAVAVLDGVARSRRPGGTDTRRRSRVELARRAIRLSTWPGETSCSTRSPGRARRCWRPASSAAGPIGMERSERYCELAVSRLAQPGFDFRGAA